MHITKDKEVESWIRDKAFSKLTFLEECWKTSGNELYAGYYYFVKDLKEQCLEDVFSYILSKKGDEFASYLYLANIADRIYSYNYLRHIPAAYYRKAASLDETNSAAQWGIYCTDRCLNAYISSLSIDLENGKLNELNSKISKFLSFPHKDVKHLSKEQRVRLERVLCDPKVDESPEQQSALVSLYFHTEDKSKGLAIMERMPSISFDIISDYLNAGIIDREYAKSKTNWFYIDRVLGDDYELMYAEAVKEKSKGGVNPTSSFLIEKAFRAKRYADVIKHYTDDSDNHFYGSSDRIYYLLSQLYLKIPLSSDVNDLVMHGVDPLEASKDPLYLALVIKKNISSLIKDMSTDAVYEFEIDILSKYKKTVDLLEAPELQKHYLYEILDEELDTVKCNWNKIYFRKRKEKLITEVENGTDDENKLFELCALEIECEQYDSVIKKIESYHKRSKGKVTSHNLLAVSFEKSGQDELALKQYKAALDLMYQTSDMNHIVISNYVECSKRISGKEISNDMMNDLKRDFNIALTNAFKWRPFIGKRLDRLFKYSPLNVNTIDSLTNQYFYLANKGQLNDPIELPELNHVGGSGLIDSEYNICSFSHNDNSMLMWSHYAQEHQGIMAEYWFGGDFPNGVGIGQVDYDEDIKRNKNINLYVFNQFLLTKNRDWSYEDEVRIFSSLQNTVKYDFFDFPNHDRNMINARLISITLGYKFPESKKGLVIKIIEAINSRRANYEPQIVLREAYISEDNKFSLRYRDVNYSAEGFGGGHNAI